MFYGLARALKLQSAINGLPNILGGVLPADFNLFKAGRNRLSFLTKKSRQEFHFISENSANQQKMFTISKKLLNIQEEVMITCSLNFQTLNDGRINLFVLFFQFVFKP